MIYPMKSAPTDRVICVEFDGGEKNQLWHVRRSGGLWMNNGRQPHGTPVGWRDRTANDGVMDCRRIGQRRRDDV